jgi:flavin-dependent dehydrogenase
VPDTADVAIVGGGPAGCALAIRLADRGISSIVIERSARPQWRACGVFSSPLTRDRLRDLGLPDAQVSALNRPISALRLQTTRGAECRLTYEHGNACGFDRVALDGALLDRAREAGVTVRMATIWRSIELATTPGGDTWMTVSRTNAHRRGDTRRLRVKLIVGADGTFSRIASDPRFSTGNRRFHRFRSGITFHRPDEAAPPDGQPMEGRFLFGDGWYVGVAPVPRGRVNIGIVVPAPWLRQRPEVVVDGVLGAFPKPQPTWIASPTTDAVRVAGGLMWLPKRVAGKGYLLVGDAAGFIDPLSGEGLHRAFVSAEMAAESIASSLRGNRSALDDYDRHLRGRFRNKDVVSWVLQAFVSRPRLLDYAVRRLASRPAQRSVFTLVLTDQLPAARALEPRFLARLLAP